ncbi:hypothetical protein HYE68_007221 [Fusarium pseudograminearum]|nr:hypothetical protein HYE68_007221 [Fusarium pseudograminearum]
MEEELTKSQNKISLLEKDLSTSREQLKAAKQSTQICVLSLNSNPTSDLLGRLLFLEWESFWDSTTGSVGRGNLLVVDI